MEQVEVMRKIEYLVDSEVGRKMKDERCRMLLPILSDSSPFYKYACSLSLIILELFDDNCDNDDNT